jgi:hypothetical protein
MVTGAAASSSHATAAPAGAWQALRRSIVTEVLDARLQSTLTPNRELRRNYALPDGQRVQLFSALCLLLVQVP